MIEKVDSRYPVEGTNFYYFRRGKQIFLGTSHAIPPMTVHSPGDNPWVMLNPGQKSKIAGKLKDALDDYLRMGA